MKKSNLITILLIIAAIVIAGYACKKSDSAPAPTSSQFAVSIATDPTLGKYLVDKDGFSLYFFSNDYKGRNSCSGGCAAYWPYFSAGTLTSANLGAGLNLADFDTIMVNGTSQTRYKGWPLYYYAPAGIDKEPAGQITGEAVEHWFVAKPDYTIMLANGQLVGSTGKSYTGAYVEGIENTVYFTDAKGASLYIYKPDSMNMNRFTKPDFSNNVSWPIYDTTNIVVPSSLDKTLFSSITVYGRHQITYKGWPLYYFGSDAHVMGNTKGITIPTTKAVGSVWPIAVKGLDPAPHK